MSSALSACIPPWTADGPNERFARRAASDYGCRFPEEIDEGGRSLDVPEHMLPALLKPAREAHARSALRLAVDLPGRPGRPDGCNEETGIPSRQHSRMLRTGHPRGCLGSTIGRNRCRAEAARPQGPRVRRESKEALERRLSGHGEVSVDWRGIIGRRSRQLAARPGSHYGRPRLRRRTWQGRHDPWAGRSSRSTHLIVPRVTSGTSEADGLCIPTPSASCGVARRHWAFFLEWERRAVRPASNGRPHRTLPALLLFAPAHRRSWSAALPPRRS